MGKLSRMPDVFSKHERSYVMSRIRSSGNRSTELRLLLLMKEERITGWRRRHRLIGRPDFVFPKERLAVFVDGCFWHGCPRCRNTPATNEAYWSEKNERNRARDRLITRTLRGEGWCVLRIWEHSLRRPASVLVRIQRALAAARARRRISSRPDILGAVSREAYEPAKLPRLHGVQMIEA